MKDVENCKRKERKNMALKLNGDKRNQYYWDNICKMQEKQTAKGLATYGQTLEENTELSMTERLTYLEEELIDALMYIEHIKVLLGGNNND